MTTFVTKRTFSAVGIALCLGSSIATLPAFAQDQNEFPGRRVGGGTRGGCAINAAAVIAIHPANNLGVTHQDSPTLYFAVPESAAAYQITFLLQDEAAVSVHEETLDAGHRDELVGLQIPAQILEAGQYYQWYFVASCDPTNSATDIVLQGWLQQAEATPATIATSESALAQIEAYQEAGWWSDAIALTAELLEAQPDAADAQMQWFELLADLKLDTAIDELLPVRLPDELE